MWQLPRILYVAAAFTIAMAAIRAESAHGGNAHAAELLIIQEGGMASYMCPLPGKRPGNLAISRGDTITVLHRKLRELPSLQ